MSNTSTHSSTRRLTEGGICIAHAPPALEKALTPAAEPL